MTPTASSLSTFSARSCEPASQGGRQNDPHFLPAGALAYRRDLPDAEIVLLDTGHFALETHAAAIGDAMRRFLAIHFDEKSD